MSELGDSEIEAFLASAYKQEVRQTEIEAGLLYVETAVSDALKKAGYVSVQNPTRRQLIEDEFASQLRQHNPEVSDEIVKITVAAFEAKMTLNEEAAITLIQMQLALNEGLVRQAKPIDSTHSKRELYARLLVGQELPARDPILTALNEVLPGHVVEPEAEYMVPYIAEAIQKKELSKLRLTKAQAEVRTIMRACGIEETDPEWVALESDVSAMYERALSYIDTNENRSNLNAALQQMPVRSLAPEVRQRLINFFTTYQIED